MRDYAVFYAALETNVANLADFPQFILTLNEEDAKLNAQGMTPSNGGEIVTAKVAIKYPSKTELYSLIFLGVQLAIKDPNNPFHNKNISFDFSETGASIFRSQGVNSKVEKTGFKETAGDLSGSGALVTNFVAFMKGLIRIASSTGDKRGVGILTDLLNQFLSGTRSITDILTFLTTFTI